MLLEQRPQSTSGPRLARIRPAFDVAFYGVVEPSPLPLPNENGVSSIVVGEAELEKSNYEERLDETIEEARRVMRANLSRHDFSIDEVAEQISLCKRQLQRMFRAAQSLGFRAELTEMRMEKASRLLSLEDKTVSEVSEEVGYRQPMHFAKAFRRHFKCSPREYRSRSRARQAAAA